MLFNPRASFDLARALHTAAGAPLGQVFSFLSGLYFRGKLEYARAYARPPAGVPGVFVITAGDGLCLPEMRVQLDVLERWAEIPIGTGESRYTDGKTYSMVVYGRQGDDTRLVVPEGGSQATGGLTWRNCSNRRGAL